MLLAKVNLTSIQKIGRTMYRRHLFFISSLGLASVLIAVAQQPPRPRLHRVIKKGNLQPIPADSTNPQTNEVSIDIVGNQRVIQANGIPAHKTGTFPNRGNPNRISVQDHEYRIPANPKQATESTPIQGEFGVAINGVPFDPGAGEFYDGEPGWQYEPLSGAIALGIDVSHAHVQPNGKYHYHGLPTGLLDSVKLNSKQHSPLIGWAADGFPIYAVYGYSDPNDSKSKVQKLSSSYQLKTGSRPGGDAPAGIYDGTFVRDYEYVPGSGDLDECNGRQTVTPEFPNGTYAYFLTEQWPVIPRFWKGTPSQDFQRGRAGGGQLFPRGLGERSAGRSPMGQRPTGPNGFGGSRDFGAPGSRRPNGNQPFGAPPKPGQILPDFVKRSLNLTDDQQQQIDKLQISVDEQLREILTEEQIRRLENGAGLRSPRNPPRF